MGWIQASLESCCLLSHDKDCQVLPSSFDQQGPFLISLEGGRKGERNLCFSAGCCEAPSSPSASTCFPFCKAEGEGLGETFFVCLTCLVVTLREWLWFELHELVGELFFFFENMRSGPFLLQVLLPPPPPLRFRWSHCCLVWCLLYASNVWEAMVHRRVIVVWMNPSPEFLRVSFWPRWLQLIRCRLTHVSKEQPLS